MRFTGCVEFFLTMQVEGNSQREQTIVMSSSSVKSMNMKNHTVIYPFFGHG